MKFQWNTFTLSEAPDQGQLGSCALLAAATGMTYQERIGKVGGRRFTRFQLTDPLTGMEATVTVTTGAKGGAKGIYGRLEAAYNALSDVFAMTPADALRVTGKHDIETIPMDYMGENDIVPNMPAVQQKIEDALQAGKTVLFATFDESEHYLANHCYRVALGMTVVNPWGHDGKAVIGANDGKLPTTFAELAAEQPYSYFTIGS